MENVKKFKRKIKIRLLDSSNPDSYVCEIFDSSLDNEDIPNFSKNVNSSKSSKELDDSNLKSYFEILMSNGCKKNFKNTYSKDSTLHYKKPKILQVEANETKIKTKTINKLQNGEVLQLEKVKGKRNCESDSSDEESVFEVNKRNKASISLKKTKFDICTKSPGKLKIGDVEVLYEANAITHRSEFLSQRQNVNILNYFGKIESDKKIDRVNRKLENLEEIILSDTSNKPHAKSCKKVLNKENIKLAPLFLRKEKKAIDLTKQKARYDFLHTESKFLRLPENNKKQETDLGFYPTCHVQQRDNSIYWSVREIPSPVPELCFVKEFKNRESFKANIFRRNPVLRSENGENKNEIKQSALVQVNAKVVNEMKSKYANLNLDLVIDGLKSKSDKFSKLTNDLITRKTKYKKSHPLRSENDDSNVELFNSLLTEKYKPSSWEILGNETVVEKLKNWLQSWKAFDEELKNSGNRKSNRNIDEDENYDDDDDDDDDSWFVSSDAETCDLKAPSSVCLLSGPNGCGKTALISSLAEELEFNVLEVNASSKRTGKKVLTDFQEATQSHKVQHTSLPLFKNVHTTGDKRKKNKKTKNKKLDSNKRIEEANERKISLLLIEDADIVFEEHDEGFYSAIASLVQTSKRPFVFITNNFNSLNLDSFKTEECLLLEMQHPPFNKSCAVLEVVSVLEGALLKKETAEFLVRQNQFDLRKSLLELQFWNNPSEQNLKPVEFDLGQFWWGLSKFLYSKIQEPVQSELAQPVLCKRKKHRDGTTLSNEEEVLIKRAKINSKDELRLRASSLDASLAESRRHSSIGFFTNLLDVASTLDLIGLSSNEEPIPGVNYRAKSSLSLEENMDGVFCAEKKLKEELSDELTALSARLFTESFGHTKRLEKEVNYLAPSWEDVRWRNSQDEAREELSLLIPSVNGRDRKSVDLDYLPIIRNICRLEKNRSATNSKRKNRFCHYFNCSEVQLSGKTLEISCKVFNR